MLMAMCVGLHNSSNMLLLLLQPIQYGRCLSWRRTTSTWLARLWGRIQAMACPHERSFGLRQTFYDATFAITHGILCIC